ncbi:MAG: single-stranded DNA-binding protein [Azospira oryzae]|uniref:Single-stranded DNA-binding protein n=1 Tax=Pelomicrobium methylotrophicum TaxID=2602750 RepID=A0A5C7EFZ6_9PROT|nr:single-stranded DNA-binding protein [Pelomicrobium methylotrophicum]PZP55882.1 MAG: single-stranded DNA-binding protein [Azospira oryzae]PZP78178.1 MAG: single-stranded DNA-binding protein [Azospira oryzae]TXF11152.1 single-stranded DNA-binding protein [Pelomicrobium methylotrophicum]
MLNKVQLIGFLGADPDVRYTQDGDAIARFRLATHETFRDGKGEKQDRTEWHNIVMFGRLAEIAKEHLKKGSLAYVEGHLHTRSWEKDGETRYTTEIVAESMKMLPSGKAKDDHEAPKTAKSGKSAAKHYDDGPF